MGDDQELAELLARSGDEPVPWHVMFKLTNTNRRAEFSSRRYLRARRDDDDGLQDAFREINLLAAGRKCHEADWPADCPSSGVQHGEVLRPIRSGQDRVYLASPVRFLRGPEPTQGSQQWNFRIGRRSKFLIDVLQLVT